MAAGQWWWAMMTTRVLRGGIMPVVVEILQWCPIELKLVCQRKGKGRGSMTRALEPMKPTNLLLKTLRMADHTLLEPFNNRNQVKLIG